MNAMTPILLIAVAAALVFLIVKITGRPASVAPGPSPTAAPQATAPANAGLRDLLFGDVPLEQWHGNHSTLPPWTLFTQAQQQIAAGQNTEAVATLRQVVAMPDLESRQYLQAWNSLRQLGVTPSPDQAKQVLGVVVDVGMPGGLDTLAAYADHSARFFHFSGQTVIWEHPSELLDGVIDRLLQRASTIVTQIGPWDKARPAPPRQGRMRLSFLTPSGLHFGEGDVSVLSSDPLATEAINTATELMQRLMELSQAKK